LNDLKTRVFSHFILHIMGFFWYLLEFSSWNNFGMWVFYWFLNIGWRKFKRKSRTWRIKCINNLVLRSFNLLCIIVIDSDLCLTTIKIPRHPLHSNSHYDHMLGLRVVVVASIFCIEALVLLYYFGYKHLGSCYEHLVIVINFSTILHWLGLQVRSFIPLS